MLSVALVGFIASAAISGANGASPYARDDVPVVISDSTKHQVLWNSSAEGIFLEPIEEETTFVILDAKKAADAPDGLLQRTVMLHIYLYQPDATETFFNGHQTQLYMTARTKEVRRASKCNEWNSVEHRTDNTLILSECIEECEETSECDAMQFTPTNRKTPRQVGECKLMQRCELRDLVDASDDDTVVIIKTKGVSTPVRRRYSFPCECGQNGCDQITLTLVPKKGHAIRLARAILMSFVHRGRTVYADPRVVLPYA